MLDAIDAMGIECIVCLGDIVGYNADPEDCVSLISERRIACVRGNHDAVGSGCDQPTHFGQRAKHAIRWTADRLSTRSRKMLAELPIAQNIDDRFLIVHASLHPRPNDLLRIRSQDDARATLKALARDYPVLRLCFFGHTHVPVAYRLSGDRVTCVHGNPVEVDGHSTYLVNPGSVGEPRDNDERASFATYDAADGLIHYHRVAYDHERAMRKTREAGLLYSPGMLVRGGCWVRDRYYEARGLLSRIRARP